MKARRIVKTMSINLEFDQEGEPFAFKELIGKMLNQDSIKLTLMQKHILNIINEGLTYE